MNFASYEFWKLLVLCFISSRLILAAVKVIRPNAHQTTAKLCLLGTALVLLTAESWLTLAAFAWVVLLGWLSVLLQENQTLRRIKSPLWILLLVAQLTPLFYYKYWSFVLNDLLGWNVSTPSILIPMGLSFYTFQTIGFWVDQQRNPKPRPTFLDYLNFSSFFPQIVAGPIEKQESLLPQIESIKFKLHRANLETAIQWIILGLAYKLIIADNIGSLSSKFSVSPSNAWHIWFECFGFGIRIYFDFAGYSFIAIGLGLLFGVKLTLNFRCPYCATSLREFWRNWHVTLGAWLRDYIYFPLGGKRVRWWPLNTIIVFLVSGIWHGAGWGFLVWGLLHGIGIAVSSLRTKWISFAPIQWGITFLYCTAAWLFFLERDPDLLRQKASAMLQPNAYSFEKIRELSTILPSPSDLLTTATIFLLAIAAVAIEATGLHFKREPYHILRRPVASLILVFMIVMLASMEESSFIYFNF